MKNKMIIGGFLLMGFVSAYAELSYMDTIKSSIDTSGFYLNWNMCNKVRLRYEITDAMVETYSKPILEIKDKPYIKSKLIDHSVKGIAYTNSIPLYVSGANSYIRFFGGKSESLEKVVQYNAWYNKHHMPYVLDTKGGEVKQHDYLTGELLTKALIAEIAEPVIFLTADHGIEKAVDILSETEMGKSISQIVPQQYHQFAKKNGKICLAALAARSVGTIAKGESVSENAKAFGKSTFVHLGSNGLEEYVINPRIDEYMGSEDSNTKECVKLAANGLALYGLHVGLNAGLKVLGA